MELFLGLGRYEPIRDILIRLFKAQNPDGDWPQWFMFFDRERNIRAGDSHGDIVFWPVLALAQYLIASEDGSLLDEIVPFFHPEGDDQAEKATLWQHVERALAVMNRRVIPGTRLAAYGHGDWNDSMQPADPDHARAPLQCLDRDAPLPDAHCACRGTQSAGPKRSGKSIHSHSRVKSAINSSDICW